MQIAYERGAFSLSALSFNFEYGGASWIMLLIGGVFVDAVGFVIINNTDGEWDNTFTTGLADGTYCDVISGAVSGSSCTGTTYVYKFLYTPIFFSFRVAG